MELWNSDGAESYHLSDKILRGDSYWTKVYFNLRYDAVYYDRTEES